MHLKKAIARTGARGTIETRLLHFCSLMRARPHHISPLSKAKFSRYLVSDVRKP